MVYPVTIVIENSGLYKGMNAKKALGWLDLSGLQKCYVLDLLGIVEVECLSFDTFSPLPTKATSQAYGTLSE